MDLSRVSRSELIAIVGGALLAVSLFLSWYHASALGAINNIRGPHSFTGWDVHTVLRWALLAAAAAPLILTWIIVRGHALSWPRGEVTAVVAIAAFGFLAWNGLISKPGDPTGEIGLQYGFFVAIGGCALMLLGAATRSSETGRTRKPPGTL